MVKEMTDIQSHYLLIYLVHYQEIKHMHSPKPTFRLDQQVILQFPKCDLIKHRSICFSEDLMKDLGPVYRL